MIIPGHSWVLHISVTIESPEQLEPPCSALIFIDLKLVRFPPPHSTEHEPISHSPHSQFTETKFIFCLYRKLKYGIKFAVSLRTPCFLLLPGHFCILQFSVILESPEQFKPPFDACTATFLVSTRVPPPHSAEHSPIFHSSHSQLTRIFSNKSRFSKLVMI